MNDNTVLQDDVHIDSEVVTKLPPYTVNYPLIALVFVRGFRRAYKRRGLYLRGLITRMKIALSRIHFSTSWKDAYIRGVYNRIFFVVYR